MGIYAFRWSYTHLVDTKIDVFMGIILFLYRNFGGNFVCGTGTGMEIQKLGRILKKDILWGFSETSKW